MVLNQQTLITVVIVFSMYVDDSIKGQMDIVGKALACQIEQLINQSELGTRSASKDPDLIDAVQSKDVDSVLLIANKLQHENGVKQMVITDANGTVLVRTNDVTNNGDSISEQPNIAKALSGTTVTSFEKSSEFAMAICTGAPIYSKQGEVIGAISTAYRLDEEAFVDKCKDIYDAEITIFSGGERVATTVVDGDGMRTIGTMAADNVIKTVIEQGDSFLGKAKILEKEAFVKYQPLLSADGSVSGMIFNGQHTDVKNTVVIRFLLQSLLVGAVLIGIGIYAGLRSSNKIVRPIYEMVGVANRIAIGDVDLQLDINTGDEIEDLAEAFNKMIDATQKQADIIKTIAGGDFSVDVELRSQHDVVGEALQTMLDTNNEVYKKIYEVADQVASGAEQVEEGALVLAESTAEQSLSVEKLLVSVEQISKRTSQSAQAAGEAVQIGSEIETRAEGGMGQMDRMIVAVKEINQASSGISNVIKVIQDIAAQTNLLSLNAAVEAARAGQQGKGFAVVAEEVRILASKSSEAVKDSQTLINDTMEKAQIGSRIAEETAQALVKIIDSISDSTVMIDDIASSADQQEESIKSINISVTSVVEAVHSVSALVEETAASSEQMNSNAHLLRELVGQFTLRA